MLICRSDRKFGPTGEQLRGPENYRCSANCVLEELRTKSRARSSVSSSQSELVGLRPLGTTPRAAYPDVRFEGEISGEGPINEVTGIEGLSIFPI